MSRDVYDEWNDDGTLPTIKPCPFCGSAGVLNDNGYERPVIDMDTGAYIDMDIHEGDGFWCECPECGAILPGADTPEGAIKQWNRRVDPPNDPLTLEELREMDGESVWIAEEQRYAFLRVGGDFLCVSRNRLQWDLVAAAQAGETVGGRTFYRRKPEEERK